MGLRRSPWLRDFSRLFDGDTSISKLIARRAVSGERVTTVARRFLDGVSGGGARVMLGPVDAARTSGWGWWYSDGDSTYAPECKCDSSSLLGCSEGIVGSVCSAKFIVFRIDGLGSGDMDAALRSSENAPECRPLYASGSYSFTKIWLAARILRGTRGALPERLWLLDDRRESDAMGRGSAGGAGAELVEAAKFWRASSTTPTRPIGNNSE